VEYDEHTSETFNDIPELLDAQKMSYDKNE
jgi:hypothetical protein